MSSYELLELFVVSFDESVILNGKEFDADTPILTSIGWSTIAILEPTKKTRTIRVDAAPEDGVLAELLRDGDRPEWKQALAQVANETAVLRAGQVPGAASEEYGSQLFMPISRQREMAEEQEEFSRAIDVHDEPDSGGMFSLWHQPEEEVN